MSRGLGDALCRRVDGGASTGGTLCLADRRCHGLSDGVIEVPRSGLVRSSRGLNHCMLRWLACHANIRRSQS